jgi:hypothetical protein
MLLNSISLFQLFWINTEQSLDKYKIEGIMPDGLINKAADLQET